MTQLNPQDERVVAQRRKINSEAFGILMVALIASVLVQQLILNAPIKQYIVELICFIAMSLYMIIRYVTLGVNIYGNEKRAKAIPLVNSVVTGVVVAAINGVLNYTEYAERYQADGIGYFFALLAVTFISTTVFTFCVLSFVGYLNTRRQAQIQKRLDDAEQDDWS